MKFFEKKVKKDAEKFGGMKKKHYLCYLLKEDSCLRASLVEGILKLCPCMSQTAEMIYVHKFVVKIHIYVVAVALQ